MEVFKSWTIWLAAGVEACAAAVIAMGALEGIVRALATFANRRAMTAHVESRKQEIRLRLGRWLALALEFELAADILRTAVAPSWDDIGKLGAIVVLRTLLNYFLQREIDAEAKLDRALGSHPSRGDAS